MITFKEYIDWEEETGYLKSSGGKGSGGRGGYTEHVKGERATIHWTDPKSRIKNVTTVIPPVQYKPAKDTRTLKKYVKQFTDDIKKKGGKVKKVVMGK